MTQVASQVTYIFLQNSTSTRIVMMGQENGNSSAFIPMKVDITVAGVKKTSYNDVYFPFDKPGQPFMSDELKQFAVDNLYSLERTESAANINTDTAVYTS